MAFRFSDKTYDCGLQTKIEGAINNHDLREAFELIGSFRKGQTPAEKVQWAQTLIEAYRGLAEVYIGVEDGLQRQLDGELTKYKELGECVEVVERLERLAEYEKLVERLK